MVVAVVVLSSFWSLLSCVCIYIKASGLMLFVFAVLCFFFFFSSFPSSELLGFMGSLLESWQERVSA